MARGAKLRGPPASAVIAGERTRLRPTGDEDNMRRLADFVVRWPWVVIGLWVAVAVALPLTLPSLNEMAQKHPLAILPSDAPSSVTARKMTEAFHESGSEDLLLVVLTDEQGAWPRRRSRPTANWWTRCARTRETS